MTDRTATAVSALTLAFQCVLILVLVCLSGAFSGSEAALFSQTAAQSQHDSTSPNRLRRLAAALLRDGKRTLMMILLGNTAVNTLLFAVSYVLFESLGDRFGAWLSAVGAALTVLLVILLGETVPKVLGVTLSDRLVGDTRRPGPRSMFPCRATTAAPNW